MRSKIPHSKSTRNDEKRVASGIPTNDPAPVYDAFALLGIPHIEREEFNRMYHGPLATALTFVSEHMKGRREVALARHRIHQVREERLKSHMKQPDDIIRPATDKATSILSRVKKNAEMLRRQLVDQQMDLEKNQITLEELRRDLKEKRRTKLLLSVLEQKEKIRIERFQEMSKLISDLRKAVSAVKSQPSPSNNTKISDNALATKARPPRISHTLNALTNFHAHHLVLSRLIKSRDTTESELFTKLRARIAEQTGKSETDPNTKKILDQFVSVARARAHQRQRLRSPALPPVSELELEKKHKLYRAKEKDLQNLSDLTVALGFLCEHSISSVNIFVEKSAPVLRASLEEEAPLAKGYIDVLRCIISAPADGISGEPRFTQQVKEVCGLGGRIIPSEIVAWVETTIRKAHRQALFLEALAIPEHSLVTEGQDALIASYGMNAKDVQDRTIKLLTRKIEKAEMGYSLAKDVQNLLQETKSIIG